MNRENESQMTDLSGVKFPSTVEYTLEHELGRGGMGIVFLAQRDSQGVIDLVVLKTIISITEKYIEKLKKEANIATGLRHENIVKTYGLEAIRMSELPTVIRKELKGMEKGVQKSARQFGRRGIARHLKRKRSRRRAGRKGGRGSRSGRQIYMICMDYVDGTDLGGLHHTHIKNNLLLPVPLGAFVISRICRALDYAHEHIVHRDISPENILVNKHGVCKLTDFGIAVESDEPVQLFAGKIGYMAPEQTRAESVDSRADIFSLGVVAYELLTGIRLFGNPGGTQLTERVENVQMLHRSPPPPPHEVRKDVPEILSEIVMKMLEFDPAERYQEIGRVGNQLEQNYLYAEGFGPTNNSLQVYMDIFRSGFKEYDKSQLKQLRFLGDNGKIKLKRKIQKKDYTQKGWAFLQTRGL